MLNPKTVWRREPHTEAKHAILGTYLKGWFPVMGKNSPRMLYVDGFAGPGEYSEGEPGSPLIALGVAASHSLLDKMLKGELVFIFIEKDPDRFSNMKDRVAAGSWPKNFRIYPIQGAFAEVFHEVLPKLEEKGHQLAPAFVFVDPFGPEGFPMVLLSRLLQHPRCELLVNVDYNGLNRWYLSDASKHGACDALFSTDEWRRYLSLPTKERERALMELYQKQLKSASAHTLSFRMVNRHNQTEYYLIFVSKHPLGLRIMKDAMWKVDPSGNFTFSDMSNPYQPRLLDKALDEMLTGEVAEELLRAFKGQRVGKASLEEWADFHPQCRQTHLRRALAQLEDTGEIVVHDPEKRRRHTFPQRVEVTFLS